MVQALNSDNNPSRYSASFKMFGVTIQTVLETHWLQRSKAMPRRETHDSRGRKPRSNAKTKASASGCDVDVARL